MSPWVLFKHAWKKKSAENYHNYYRPILDFSG